MGIPTGPQQGRNPREGGVPANRTPGNNQPAQPRRAPADGPQQQRPPQQRPAQPARSTENQLPELPPRRPTVPSREQRAPAGLPQRTPAPAQRPQQRPVQQLPPVEDEQFDDPFSFGGTEDDLFSDVPQSARDNSSTEYPLDDDPFEAVGAAQSDEYNEDESHYEPEPTPPKVAPRVPAATPRRLQGNSKAPERSIASTDDYEDEFVDRKNLKLKPFGSNKLKGRAKVGDFDVRKNMEGQRKLYRSIFVGALVAVVGFGAYQTFWPQESLSVSEVESIASFTVGDTGFPTTKGEGFALSFMDSLLNIEPGPVALAQRNAALNYFYGGTGDSRASSAALSVAGNVSQSVVYGPVVLESSPLTANAASYEIGVLLSTSDANTPLADGSVGAEQAASALRWVSFNVNVYYDELTNSFAVAPNSPTLLPAPSVAAPSLVPAAEPLGEPVDNYPTSVDATVEGFLEGYRVSTKTEFSKILQYIGSEADESLRDGLGGRYSFAIPDDVSSSIDTKVFSPGGSDDLSELKLAITVDWQIPSGAESSVTFPSHYVLTLTSTGSAGDYTVSKFAPYYWIEAIATEAE